MDPDPLNTVIELPALEILSVEEMLEEDRVCSLMQLACMELETCTL